MKELHIKELEDGRYSVQSGPCGGMGHEKVFYSLRALLKYVRQFFK